MGISKAVFWGATSEASCCMEWEWRVSNSSEIDFTEITIKQINKQITITIHMGGENAQSC